MPNPTPVIVTVTETESVQGHSKTVQVQLSQEPIDLTTCLNAQVDIEWQVRSVTSGRPWYVGNLVVADAPSNPNSAQAAFTAPGQLGPKHRYGLSRKANNAGTGTHKYTITLTDGQQAVTLDPSIINQP